MATRPARTRWDALRYAVHLAAAVPLVRALAGAFGLAGQTLGPDPVEALIESFGWWALFLLLAGLAVTPLRQLAGRVQLVRLRRPLGLWGFTYVVLHLATYFGLEQELDPRVIIEDITKRPYIMVGMAAFLLLVPLAATSTQGAMRRLGRRWQKLHRLAYATAALGVLHFALQVKKDLREPLVFAAVLAALLGWRAWRHYSAGKFATGVREGHTASATPASTSAPPT